MRQPRRSAWIFLMLGAVVVGFLKDKEHLAKCTDVGAIAKQQRLVAELHGFWREDIWDMRNRPVKAGNCVINIRTFLEVAAREHWLPLGSERMIYDEEVPQPPKPQPRYIPSAVLKQLNKHLGNMKTAWMQIILILQECGMRLSELLALPLDCLTQDARGTFFLRFMQGKMKREHTIPVSQEIARVIQEQQEIVRDSQPSLFPSGNIVTLLRA